jgi:hypothetical protein
VRHPEVHAAGKEAMSSWPHNQARTVAALDAITTKYERKGKAVEIIGLNQSSAHRHERLTGQLSAH